MLLVITTVATQQDATHLSKHIVQEQLAACAQIIGPITSHYIWDGTLSENTEWQCQFKTQKKLYKEIETFIKKLHTYSTPEIIAIPITNMYEPYQVWLNQNTK